MISIVLEFAGGAVVGAIGVIIGGKLLAKYRQDKESVPRTSSSHLSEDLLKALRKKVSALPIHFVVDTLKMAEVNYSKLPNGDGSLYLTSNENERQRTLQILKNQLSFQKDPQGFYIGVSGTENLNFIYATRAKGALLFDTSVRVMRMWQLLQKTICESNHREKFLEKFVKGLENISLEDKRKMESLGEFALLNETTLSNLEWFSNPEAFRYIRHLYLHRKIVHLHIDFTDTKALSNIHSVLEQQQGRRLVYISNVFDWVVERSNEMTSEQFNQNLSLLCNKKTLVISSKRGDAHIPFAPQNVQKIRSLVPFHLEQVDEHSDVYS